VACAKQCCVDPATSQTNNAPAAITLVFTLLFIELNLLQLGWAFSSANPAADENEKLGWSKTTLIRPSSAQIRSRQDDTHRAITASSIIL
jgi:hypothetical protein